MILSTFPDPAQDEERKNPAAISGWPLRCGNVRSARESSVNLQMNSVINFVELENRIVSATYRNLMVKAKVVLVQQASGEQLPEPVTTIASPLPSGSLRIRLPDSVRPGTYFLKALNAHGEFAARSAAFEVC